MGLNCMYAYHYNMFTRSKIIVITYLFTMHKMAKLVGYCGWCCQGQPVAKNTAPWMAAAGQMIDSQDRCIAVLHNEKALSTYASTLAATIYSMCTFWNNVNPVSIAYVNNVCWITFNKWNINRDIWRKKVSHFLRTNSAFLFPDISKVTYITCLLKTYLMHFSNIS